MLTPRRSQAIDVQHYAARHPDFPNQTTADQFFNEEQFESPLDVGLNLEESADREESLELHTRTDVAAPQK